MTTELDKTKKQQESKRETEPDSFASKWHRLKLILMECLDDRASGDEARCVTNKRKKSIEFGLKICRIIHGHNLSTCPRVIVVDI